MASMSTLRLDRFASCPKPPYYAWDGSRDGKDPIE
jgi:hypothetical protein